MVSRLNSYLIFYSIDFSMSTSSSVSLTSIDAESCFVADGDDKIFGIPKYDLSHLDNLTVDEYLEAVSSNPCCHSVFC